MTEKKKNFKQWFVVALGVILYVVLMAFFVYVGFWFLFPTPNWKRKKMCTYYAAKEGNTILQGTLSAENIFYYEDEAFFNFQQKTILSGEWGDNSDECKVYLCTSNLLALQENGFFDALEGGVEVIFTTNYATWWDGWVYPLLELKIGDAVYLDYETGLQNFLDWIENEMY